MQALSNSSCALIERSTSDSGSTGRDVVYSNALSLGDVSLPDSYCDPVPGNTQRESVSFGRLDKIRRNGERPDVDSIQNMRIGNFGERVIDAPRTIQIAYKYGDVVVRVSASVASGSRAKQDDPRYPSWKSRMCFISECSQMVSSLLFH
jgi:hypothetical protein